MSSINSPLATIFSNLSRRIRKSRIVSNPKLLRSLAGKILRLITVKEMKDQNLVNDKKSDAKSLNDNSNLEEIGRGALEAHLAEYTALREELLARFESQRQAFNYLVVILSGSVTVFAIFAELGRPDLTSLITLFLPIVIAPLGFIFFDNELMIHANGFYVFKYLGKRVSQIVKDEALFVEMGRSTSLSKNTWRIHRILSVGRWVLFIGPVIGPMIYLLAYTDFWWHAPYVYIFALDVILAFILILGTIFVLRVNIVWASLER